MSERLTPKIILKTVITIVRGALASLLIICWAPHALAIIGGKLDASPIDGTMVQIGICSGLLIASDVVLTAGHCDNELIVWHDAAGVNYSASKKDRISAAPGADLALLRLASPVAASPALLSAKTPWLAEQVSIVGFGEAVPGQEASAGKLRSATVSVIQPLINDGLTVWAENGGAAGACKGDSGGALRLGTAVIAVITSIIAPCGNVTIAVLLGPQREWIDQSLSGWGRTARWDGL